MNQRKITFVIVHAMRSILYIVFLSSTIIATLCGQESVQEITLDDRLVTALIVDGDTFLIADLDRVTVSSPREFDSREDYRIYKRYKRYAGVVYPYASEAIRILARYEQDTENLSRRKKKKYSKNLSKELKENFKDPMKNLTKTQGRILIEMIEKELDQSMFDLLKTTRGGFAAGTWQSKGKLFGYDLKEKYARGQDPLLDIVLDDFDISLGTE